MADRLSKAQRQMNEMKLLHAANRGRRRDGGNIVISAHSKKRMGFKEPEWNYPQTGISIMELKHNSCRFPFSNGTYCGKITIPEKSFCPECHAKCFTGKGKRL